MAEGETNYRLAEVRDTNGRLIGHRHQQEVTPAVFLRPTTPRQTDRDEWGLAPSQQPQGPGWRGSGMVQEADAPKRPVSSLEAQRRTAALAFSNAPIPAVDLANAMADPHLGPIVREKVAIDLANRRAGRDQVDAMLGAWSREHTIDLSRGPAEPNETVDLINAAISETAIDLALALPNEPAQMSPKEEEMTMRFLLDDEATGDLGDFLVECAKTGAHGVTWDSSFAGRVSL